MRGPRSKENQLGAVAWEVGVYGVLVACFCLAIVLSPAAGVLTRLSRDDKPLYAAAALGLLLFQGFVLEWLARRILAGVAALRGKRP